eukprot:jgi/Astpho2/4891/fgenesh1_pm.00069_%23_15_t
MSTKRLAREKLPAAVYGYYAGGAETESTLRDNRAVYSRYRLMPRIMVNVSKVSLSMTLLGHRLKLPILVAPMAMQRMAHPDGELAVAKAAAQAGSAMVLSTMSTTSMEDVAQAVGSSVLRFFQLYIIKDREYTRELLQRAEKSGYNAVMVTVDAPHLGNREADARNGFRLPDGLRLEHLEGLAKRHKDTTPKDTPFIKVFGSHVDDSQTWDFVTWMHSVTSLPIFVKGILSPSDARIAVDSGVDGIVVSNHGGRQLDCAPASLDVIQLVRQAVGRRVPILMDGGIRRGTDVLKALALGADAVLLGRPILYGLALEGQAGVTRVLNIIEKELMLAMILAGCRDLKSITGDLIMPPTGISYGLIPSRL